MSSARRFRVHGLLGKGGFGAVYRATLESEGFQTEVAIKLLKTTDLPAHMLKRFKDEARVLGLIRDRAVVRVYPPALLDGTPAVVMEFVDGQSTAGLVKMQQGPLPTRVATEIIAEVARSLHDVFTQPGPDGSPLALVHRDIKPANLQVTPNGGVKVLDFGIAKATFEGREAETTAQIFGTPQYMAPERLDGIAGPESDVYSLGVTWRRLMTGDRPTGMGRFKPSPKPPTPSAMLDRANAFIARMLADEPEDRPTADETASFALDLAARMEGASLREWAKENVLSAPAMTDDLAGTILLETIGTGMATELDFVDGLSDTEQASTTAETRTIAARRAFLGFGFLASLMLVGSVGLGGLALYLFLNPGGDAPITTTTEPIAPVPPEPAPVIAPDPVPVPPQPGTEEPDADPVEPVDEPEVPDTPVAPTPVTPGPAPTVAPEPAPVVPDPIVEPDTVPEPDLPPEPAPLPPPRVWTNADGVVLLLKASDGRLIAPGKAPAGTYELMASFTADGSDLKGFGMIDLAPGDNVKVACIAGQRKCRLPRK